jgi:hypothetical protein
MRKLLLILLALTGFNAFAVNYKTERFRMGCTITISKNDTTGMNHYITSDGHTSSIGSLFLVSYNYKEISIIDRKY